MDLSRTEHWIEAPHGVRLFALNVVAGPWSGTRGTLLFVHGSTWGALPSFDFGPSHQPDRNVMEVFARRGFDCWCVDMEGYGHSIGRPDVAAGIEDGARDLEAATRAIRAMRDGRALMLYGISAGALRAAVFAARHPQNHRQRPGRHRTHLRLPLRRRRRHRRPRPRQNHRRKPPPTHRRRGHGTKRRLDRPLGRTRQQRPRHPPPRDPLRHRTPRPIHRQQARTRRTILHPLRRRGRQAQRRRPGRRQARPKGPGPHPPRRHRQVRRRTTRTTHRHRVQTRRPRTRPAGRIAHPLRPRPGHTLRPPRHAHPQGRRAKPNGRLATRPNDRHRHHRARRKAATHHPGRTPPRGRTKRRHRLGRVSPTSRPLPQRRNRPRREHPARGR
ncbi:lysophospholipase [Leptolyngbya sp. 15MV]|nr:lysophospholipase [Leptolyngbya sp. 15MV]